MNRLTGVKAGILTFHRCINYGSYWQAKSLAEGLLARGIDATILDHHSGRINLAEWRCAFQPTLPTPVPEADFRLYRKKIERFFKAFESLPLSKPFAIDQPEEMELYDLAVVGSDEVWNLYHPWYGKNPLFYGEGVKAEKIISYAASFGNYPAEYGLVDEWKNRLYNFDAIAVRDENSRILIKEALGIEPQVVLDPCLQFPVEAEEHVGHHIDKPYFAVYGHNFSSIFIQQVKEWARKKNLTTISIGYRNDWADQQWIDADPFDFWHFIAGAEAVATNFFHGCVFSLRHEKPFICETSHYRSFKVQNLLAKLRAEKHLITEQTTFQEVDACLQEPISDSVFQTINHYRQRSNEYLTNALGIQQLRVA